MWRSPQIWSGVSFLESPSKIFLNLLSTRSLHLVWSFSGNSEQTCNLKWPSNTLLLHRNHFFLKDLPCPKHRWALSQCVHAQWTPQSFQQQFCKLDICRTQLKRQSPESKTRQEQWWPSFFNLEDLTEVRLPTSLLLCKNFITIIFAICFLKKCIILSRHATTTVRSLSEASKKDRLYAGPFWRFRERAHCTYRTITVYTIVFVLFDWEIVCRLCQL